MPSLLGDADAAAPQARPGSGAREARSLLDLLYDGCYMIFLLRDGQAPASAEEFRDRLKQFLAGFERGAQRLGAEPEDSHLAKFAFCALVDEVILRSDFRIREAWERRPLQTELFGEQLAGDRFFDHLERLRQGGAPRVQVLEVFHMCLLLGFQGRYLLEGSEKLAYLTARLGEEIAHLRGRRAAFAPHGERPDQVVNRLKTEVPVWVMASVFALVAALGYAGLRWGLQRQTEADLARYSGIVKVVPQAAHVTITLP